MKIILEKSEIVSNLKRHHMFPVQTGNGKVADRLRKNSNDFGATADEKDSATKTYTTNAIKGGITESAGAGLGIAAAGATLYAGKKALDSTFNKMSEHKSALEKAVEDSHLNENMGPSAAPIAPMGSTSPQIVNKYKS
jgi:hypothetical protein